MRVRERARLRTLVAAAGLRDGLRLGRRLLGGRESEVFLIFVPAIRPRFGTAPRAKKNWLEVTVAHRFAATRRRVRISARDIGAIIVAGSAGATAVVARGRDD